MDFFPFAAGVNHDVGHHDDGDGVRDDGRQVGADISLEAQPDGVKEAEHQRGQVGLGRVGGGEDHAGEGDIAAGVAHLFREGPIEVPEGKVGAGDAAQDAAEDGGGPFHLIR